MNKHSGKSRFKTWHFWDRVLLAVGVPLVIILVFVAIKYHIYPFGS